MDCVRTAPAPRLRRIGAIGLAAALLLAGTGGAPNAAAQPRPSASTIQLITVATNFNNPIGIDHHAPSQGVVVSVNYPDGRPRNFELVLPTGRHQRFSNLTGFTEEVKIASVWESDCQGGFTTGELFTGTGDPGVIARISPDGSKVQRAWVRLRGENGLLRGSLFQDRYCVFDGDLIVVTTTGGIWRVKEDGTQTRIGNLGAHLEGLTTVPNDPARFGPWAGKILIGAEEQGRLYAASADGTIESFQLGLTVEDLDIVPPDASFYGVDFQGRRIVTAGPEQWLDKVGDMIAAEENGQLWDVRWDAAAAEFVKIRLAKVAQWEHVTFSTAKIITRPPTRTPEPSATPPPTPTVPTPTPTDTTVPSPTWTPTITPTRTATATPSDTPTPTLTPTPAVYRIYLPISLDERCRDSRKHADVVLVVDTSTSMLAPTSDGVRKIDAARGAIEAFIAHFDPANDRAALVAFDDTAAVTVPLSGDLAAVTRALATLTHHEHTRLDLGLIAARAALAGVASSADRIPAVVLLTDGRPNRVPTPDGGGRQEDTVLAAADALKAAGARVYTVGFGDDVDASLLAAVASGAGDAFIAPDAAALARIYGAIAEAIPCGGVYWPGGKP
ncbi:MAG: vWA domain-containing protein [Ardenticatenales bacterium]